MSSPHMALSGEDVDKSIVLKVDLNKFCVTPGASPRYFCISVFFFSGQSELIVSVDGKIVNVTPTSAINCKEDFGGSYARVQVTGWDAPSDGATQNTSAITFPTATGDWGMVSGVIVTDHASAGNVLLHGSLTTPRDVKNGDVFKFNAGDLDITFA